MKRVILGTPTLSAWVGLAGTLTAAVLFLGTWGPLSNALQDSQVTETQRLLQSFSDPLARAVGINDDLAKIDELHRLQKLPGVLYANLIGPGSHTPNLHAPLIWEGKTLGQLSLKLSRTRLERWRYRYWERALTLIGFAGVGFLSLGFWLGRAREKVLARLLKFGKKRLDRARSRLRLTRELSEGQRNDWVRQAISLAVSPVVVLDAEQRVVACNAEAYAFFRLHPGCEGRNWFEVMPSPAWANALGKLVSHPGYPQTLSLFNDLVTLKTLSGPAQSKSSTWITAGAPVRSDRIDPTVAGLL